MFCFTSTAGQFSAKMIYKCKLVGMAYITVTVSVLGLLSSKTVLEDHKLDSVLTLVGGC